MICQEIFSILALIIFLLKLLLKSASKYFFVASASRSGFGAAISDAVARSSNVFHNSAPADRIVVAASRLLGAAAACVILLSFAAGHRKSYWSGFFKAAIVICQKIFYFGAVCTEFAVCKSCLCASFVVQSSTGKYFLQALYCTVVLGSSLCKLCDTK